MPTSMVQLKERIQEEMELIPSKMIKEAVYSTKKRALKLVEAKGEAFEGRSIRAGIHCMAIWVLSSTTITKQFFSGNILNNNVTSIQFFCRNCTTT